MPQTLNWNILQQQFIFFFFLPPPHPPTPHSPTLLTLHCVSPHGVSNVSNVVDTGIKNSRFSRDMADTLPAVERAERWLTRVHWGFNITGEDLILLFLSLHPNVVQVYCCCVDYSHTPIQQRHSCNLFSSCFRGGTILQELLRLISLSWTFLVGQGFT